jgi:SAM-dependent methyltransferase
MDKIHLHWERGLPARTTTEIIGYLDEHPDGDFQTVLEQDQRLEVFFHLSPMRESLLNWYPFHSESSLLELGGGLGALTGLYCSRCAQVVSVETDPRKADALRRRHRVPHLTVTPEAAGEFDYIVVLDPEDLGAEALESLRQRLRPHGRLLLAAENRFALRYWCGKPSRRSGLPFDSVAGRDGSLGRAALAHNLRQAGFTGLKWYYPMSDHWFAQDIFSENYLPELYSVARFAPYVEPGGTLILNEQDLYADIMASGVFPFFSNSYLIEARSHADDEPCSVDYAALTTYRSRERRFATTVHCDGTARKTPLHPAAEVSAHQMVANHRALAERGIKVVPLTWADGALSMPRVEQETLIDYWQRKLSEGGLAVEAVVTLFDRIYAYIKQSSVSEPPGTHGWDEALGAVQEVAYPELIPANCFYEEKTGELTFFDQEFSRPHCPLSIPVSRLIMAIRYSSLHRDARFASLLEELKDRYLVRACWARLEQEEGRFLSGVFNMSAIKTIESLRQVDKRMIRENVRKLL